MSLDFASQRPYLEDRRRERLARKTHGLPLLRRIDPGLLVLFVGAALLLVGFWSFWVLAGWRTGLFEPPLFRALPDARILSNIRDHLEDRPFLAAAFHRDALYLSQRGGALHRYDPATELWSNSRPFAGTSFRVGDLADLRSDEESLWARSSRGALARQVDGRWSAIFDETAFPTSGGEPPTSEDLTAAALSDDGRWLLFGTRAHGVALFDQERRIFVALEEGSDESEDREAETSALPVAVSHLRWWKDRFWIGGPKGLSYLIPALRESRHAYRRDFTGAVMDLEAGRDLYVLESRRCLGPNFSTCLRISRLREPQEDAQTLLLEEAHYPELDLDALAVAQMQVSPEGEILVVAGATGLYTYDPRLHTWKKEIEGRAVAHWRHPRRGLYVALEDEVVQFADGRRRRQWPLEGQEIRRLLPGRGDDILALGGRRDIWALRPDGEPHPILQASFTELDPRRLEDALVLQDGKVLFRGSEGLLFHDALHRTYRDIPHDRLPDWLANPKARFIASGDALFALSEPAGGRQTILSTNADKLASGDHDEPGRVAAPVLAAKPWSGDGLGLLAGDGSAYLAGQETLRRLTGGKVPGLESLSLRDVALSTEELVVATDRGVRSYRLDVRAWQDWTLPGTAVEELATLGEATWMRTSDGRLARFGGRDPYVIGPPRWPRGASSAAQPAWDVDDSDLCDARWHHDQIYLAGGGRVFRYDPRARRLNRRWELPGVRGGTDGSGRRRITRLMGVLGTANRPQPLAWAEGRAFLGDTPLDPQAGRVLGLSLGKRYIWTVRELAPGGPRYLKGHLRGRPTEPGLARCLFRHPSAGAAPLLDVRELGPGLLAALTGEGLKLYSRKDRSWYDVHWSGAPSRIERGELRRLGDRLALWTGGAGTPGQLSFFAVDALGTPGGCADDPRVDVDPEVVFEAIGASFEENGEASSAVWIGADGAVMRWRSDTLHTLLASPGGAPARRGLRRAFRFGPRLLLTSDRSVFVYDLRDHSWREQPISLPERRDRIADLNLEEHDGQLTLTVHTLSGAVYVGSFAPSVRSEQTQLTLVLPSRRSRGGAPAVGRRNGPLISPRELLDVQWRFGFWGLVFPDRLELFDPEGRRWAEPVLFPGSDDPALSLRQAVGLDVLIKDGGREWWVEQFSLDESPGTRRFARLAATGHPTAIDARAGVWRLREDGGVESCVARAGEYVCAPALAADTADPVVALEVGPEGTGLFARRPSGATELLSEQRAELEPKLPPSLDLGWLVWQRGTESARTEPAGTESTGLFRLATPSGIRSFRSEELIRNGRFLFEDVRAVLAEEPKRLHAATPYGIFTFSSATLAPSNRGVIFQPAPLGEEVRAAHGRFLSPRRSFLISEGRFEEDGYREHRISQGGRITLRERTRERTVDGTIEAQDATLSAFGDTGFTWDQRRGVAHHPRLELVVQTAAGIHPLRIGRPLDTFDLGPRGQAHQRGYLSPAPGVRLFFRDGETSHLLGAAGWRPAPSSTVFDGPITEDQIWTWSRRAGRIEVDLKESAYEFALVDGLAGWQLTSDRLRAAAFHDDRLYLAHDAFFEVTSEGLENGVRLPPLAIDEMESLPSAPGLSPGLYAWTRGASEQKAHLWDPEEEVLLSLDPGRDPLWNRDLVQLGRLRLRLRSGLLLKDLLVDDPRGGDPRWQTFRLTPRGFPFDEVEGIGTTDDRLLVSTRAGLEVYRPGEATGFDDLKTIYAVTGAGAADVRLGRPAEDPGRFLVVAGRDCFEWSSEKEALELCSQDASLEDQWLGESDLWRFSKQGDRLVGRYKHGSGELSTETVDLAGGRLPHDRLLDITACQGRAASLWENGWISLHADPNLSLQGARHVEDLVDKNPRRLHCVRRDRELSGELRLAAGLYAQGAGERYWHWNGEGWTAVSERRILDALAHPPLQELGRLRLWRRPGAGDYVYQYRRVDFTWVDLPWSSDEGRVSIDLIDDLQVIDGTLWAVTPAGLTAFRQGKDGMLELGPEALRVIPTPCPVADFEAENGKALLRCTRAQDGVFEAASDRLPREEADLFRRLEGDPFAERVLISEEESGLWDWRWIDRRVENGSKSSGEPASSSARVSAGGRGGYLDVRFRGETLGLSSGRFDFDRVTSLALRPSLPAESQGDDTLDIVAAAGGWYRPAAASLHVRELRRPGVRGVDPRDVTRITLSRQDEELLLCAETREGAAFQIAGSALRGITRECADDLGRDAVWTYARLDGRLRVRSPGLTGGWAHRGLRGGRLSDQIALGPPLAILEGEEAHHLVPTAAGVLRLDAGGRPAAFYAPEHEGLEAGEVPSALHRTAAGQPIYATSSGVFDLENGELLSPEEFRLPAEARPTSFEAGSPGFLRLLWRRGAESGWTLLRSATYAPVGDDTLVIDASTWGRFARGRAGWGESSTVFGLQRQSQGWRLLAPEGDHTAEIPWPGALRPLEVIARGPRLFVVEGGEVSEIRLDVGVAELFR